MKRFTWKAIFVMAVFFTSFHQAGWGQLVYDDFTSYTLGNLAGQGSWVKGGTGPDATVANAAPLTYAGYNGGGAEYVVMPTGTSTASRVYKLFAPVTTYNSTTFYYSLLLRVTTPGASSNGYFMSFGNAAGATASLGGKLYVKASGAGFNIGVSKTTTSAVTYGTTVLTIGQTYLIVVRYTFNLAGTTAPNCYDDQAYLWVDPVITSEPSTATAECSINGGATTDTDFDGYGAIAGGVGSFLWHSRNATNPIGDFDAVRVGHGITSSDAWTNLGAGSSVPSVETPVISPASGIFETTQTITITCATADAAIYYSTDGQPPDDSSNPYDPLNKPQVSITTTIMAIAYKAPLAPSSVASAIFRFPISVSNILALQGGDKDGFTVYKLTGEAVVTYTRPLVGGNNQKFIQDATGAVLIHDPSGIITTPYVIGDG
ncbi:MAG: chitobiase/beta-hexosaminidase C-terminal domain-containing protein, partial [Bacteroidota bacterium]